MSNKMYIYNPLQAKFFINEGVKCIDTGIHKTGSRICDRGKERCPEGIVRKTLIDLLKFFQSFLFMAKSLNHFDSFQHFIGKSGQFPSCFGLLLKHDKCFF